MMRALWTQMPATFEGEFYRCVEAYCQPRPDPPILIKVGARGPKALRVVAELADWWNWDAPWSVYSQPHEVLRQHCAEMGRPFDEIKLTAEATIWFPEKREEFQPTFDHSYYPGEEFRYIGPTAEEAVRDLQEMIDHGVSHFQLFADARELRIFADQVIPFLRG